MPKYKTQTNDLTEVIESGGAGKLYLHTINFHNNNGVIIDENNNNLSLITDINISIICSSPQLLAIKKYSQMFGDHQYVTNISYQASVTNVDASLNNKVVIHSFNIRAIPNTGFIADIWYSLSNDLNTIIDVHQIFDSQNYESINSFVVPII